MVWIKGSEDVQSSGIESNAGERLDIISSWHKAAVEHALPKANDSNVHQWPVFMMGDSADQLIIRLVLHSHGRPKTIGVEGFATKRDRF